MTLDKPVSSAKRIAPTVLENDSSRSFIQKFNTGRPSFDTTPSSQDGLLHLLSYFESTMPNLARVQNFKNMSKSNEYKGTSDL
jgi:hypothetical protein